jgi:transposase
MPEAEVDAFAGIDVSARELSVALRREKGEGKPAMAKFSNRPSGHKALIAHLLRGGRRVRVCLEASGNYSLDLALTLQAHRQVEITVINPRRARRFAESLGQRSKTDPVDARMLCEYAARMPWVAWATAQLSRPTFAGCDACHCRLGGYPYPAEQSCARVGREPSLARLGGQGDAASSEIS